ncbi:MAG TPA: hypothetical protein VK213_01705 [Bacteroidales bacterium]|nr:hypothetical protein [Bacteroidales bacterium]
MEKYYVATRPQTDEIHSIHKEGCPFMPESEKRIYLGMFPSGNDAGIIGKEYFTNTCGCRFCSKESADKKMKDASVPLYIDPVNKMYSGVMLQYLN